MSASKRPCEEESANSCEVPCLVKSQMKDRMAVQGIIKSLKIKITTRQACIFASM